MATFEVDYSWDEPQYGMITVEAPHIDAAEQVALDQLSETLDPEVTAMSIESIREVK